MRFNATKINDICTVNNPLVPRMQAAEHYVISDDLVEILHRDDCSSTISAIIKAGINRLPFSPMLIEFSAEGLRDKAPDYDEKARYFVLMEEKGGAIECHLAVLILRANKPYKGYFKDGSITVEAYEDGLIISDKFHNEMHIAAVTCATYLAFLMLNTKGIEKEVVDMKAVNKARLKKGKPQIPVYTYIRVGTVYNREGAEVKGGHRSMPVHWRSGHVRMQRFGKGWEDERPIFIPATLVNFSDGNDLPARKIRKVAK